MNARKQAIAIAIVVVLGLGAGALILRGSPSPAGGKADAHAEEGHAHGDEEKKAVAHGKEDADGHGHAEEQHAEAKQGEGQHAEARHAREKPGQEKSGKHEEEEKIAFTDAQVQSAGIVVADAAPARLRSTLQLPGEIRFDEDRTAHVVPRVAGVVDSVAASLGQRVKRGDVLAVLSSPALSGQRSDLQSAQRRLALARTTYEREKQLWDEKISARQDLQQAEQALHEARIAEADARQKLLALGAAPGSAALGRYELRAPFDGMVVEKHIAPGEAVKEDTNVFTISDLSRVWAEISVPAGQLNRVRVGETVMVRSSAFAQTASGTVSYVGSLIGAQTRTATARVTLANPQGAWRPGLFVDVDVVAAETDVPVAVSAEAIQTVENKPTVFARVEGGFEPRHVRTGRSDGARVEIVEGLAPGTPHAADGSFVVKAQQGKGAATHTH